MSVVVVTRSVLISTAALGRWKERVRELVSRFNGFRV